MTCHCRDEHELLDLGDAAVALDVLKLLIDWQAVEVEAVVAALRAAKHQPAPERIPAA